MSRINKDYKNTKRYRFHQWMNGELDSFLGKVEMREEKQDSFQSVPKRNLREKDPMIDHTLLKEKKEFRWYNRIYRVLSLVICLVLIVMLLMTVFYLPSIGDAQNPASNEVVERYIEEGIQETGAVNIVTGMILDYRAFDTFGESNVLFIAACCVLILLRIDVHDTKNNSKAEKAKIDAEMNDRLYEPKNDLILQKVAFFLVPFLMIFGIYIILNGHLSPGGGFSGGAVIGAGLILHLNAFGFKKTERFFTQKTFKTVTFCALTFYCLAKSYSFFTGANHIESHIPLGKAGAIISSGLILPLNICVGMVVACTMYAFYVLFRKGGF